MLQFQIETTGMQKDTFDDIIDFGAEQTALFNEGKVTRTLQQTSRYETNEGPADLFGYSSEIIVAFGGTAGAIAFLKYIVDKAIDWKKAGSGRSIRARIGDKEIEVKGSVDVKIVIDLLEELEKRETKNLKSDTDS